VRRAAALLAVCALAAPAAARADLAAEVDPMIGTFAPGFVFPGASVPFGMVQNSPDTEGSTLAYSGYLYTDPVIRGFSLVHLNGPGVKKAGDLPFMPTPGPASEDPRAYGSTYSHARERAEPGYYRVDLDNGVRVELTAGRRTGRQRYTFPPAGDARVIMDTARSVEGVADAGWEVTGPAEISGWRRGRYPVFFVARFDRPFVTAEPLGRGGSVTFDTTKQRRVDVQVGISFVDAAGARRNLESERRGFDAMRERARARWNRELARVRVQGTGRRAFYTALFHAYQHPNLFTDADGRYRGADDAIHVARGRTHYANFSSWDTYKAQNQLLALTQPRRFADMLASLLATAREAGRLPRWGEQSIDAAHMSGDPAIPMIADAACRGLLDRATARGLYDAAVELRAHRDGDLERLGFLPGRPGTTLEYGVADFALALLADALGHDEDARRFLAASLNYRNLIRPDGWIGPRNADGSFTEPFAPTDQTGFQEGNSWQYSWLAPHDARGLFARMGGDEVAGGRFDEFFAMPAEVETKVTLFGIHYGFPWYAPGNEHDLQAPWMPAFLGRPWQVADAHRDARTLFRPTVDGLPGNDDLGSLSAWYVLSALGFGPVIPGAPLHVVGSPQFERATIAVGGGRELAVSAPGTSALAPYVQSARLDGRPLDRSWVRDADLRDGGELELRMGPRPSGWAATAAAGPPSASDTPLAGFGCAPSHR
jgi:predicted alpha-1,2-mannosidase